MSAQHGLHSHGANTQQGAARNISTSYHTALHWRVIHDDILVLRVGDLPLLHRCHQNRMRTVHIYSESIQNSHMHNSQQLYNIVIKLRECVHAVLVDLKDIDGYFYEIKGTSLKV